MDGITVDAALGATTFPDEFIVQPLGSPEIVVVIAVLTAVSSVAVAEPIQGYMDGVMKLEVVCACVPSNGSGAVLMVGDVLVGPAGAAIVEREFPEERLPLILPPLELIDCHVPLLPEYVYCEPVE
jgi:hypothetical protein